jgi:hypothetical protein
MKSRDYHVWIDRLLPAMVQGYVPEHVWLVLAELSYFFRQLCAKELSRTMVANLEKVAHELLCKLEKIFPPGFFLSMQHLIVHLLYEARMGRAVQACWCYPIKRCLKVVRKKCRNKAKIEASIVEASIVEEVTNFTQIYYMENLPSVHNPLPLYNVDKNESNLILFQGQLGRSSGSTNKRLDNEEWRRIMIYVFHNLPEVKLFIE